MKIGIDITACRRVGCKECPDLSCNMISCDRSGALGTSHRCPIPKKCPYKAIHIMLDMKLWCGDCPKRDE